MGNHLVIDFASLLSDYGINLTDPLTADQKQKILIAIRTEREFELKKKEIQEILKSAT